MKPSVSSKACANSPRHSGVGELQSIGEVRELEAAIAAIAAIAAEHPALTAGLEAAGLHQERRVMRLRPEQPSFTMLHNSDL